MSDLMLSRALFHAWYMAALFVPLDNWKVSVVCMLMALVCLWKSYP